MSKHRRIARILIPLAGLSALISTPVTRAQQLSLSRDNATVLVEPYAPNIVRVSISLRRDDALAAPGYGISASPIPTGWTVGSDTSGDITPRAEMGSHWNQRRHSEVLQRLYARCWPLHQNPR